MEGDSAARNIAVRGDPGLCHTQQCVDIDIDIDRFIIEFLIVLCAQNLLTAHRDNLTLPTGRSQQGTAP